MTWSEQKQVLKEMGYNNYKEYVSGVVWANIRDRVLEEKKHRCIICTRRATVIHHKAYSKEILQGKDITPLEPLCWDCHNSIEYDEYGNKLSLSHANNKLQWFIRNKHKWNNGYSCIASKVIKERRYTSYPMTKLEED